jgi:hypothetical protein
MCRFSLQPLLPRLLDFFDLAPLQVAVKLPKRASRYRLAVRTTQRRKFLPRIAQRNAETGDAEPRQHRLHPVHEPSLS